MEVELRKTLAFAQGTDPDVMTVNFDDLTARHKATVAAREAANPPVPEEPENELGRLEEWKKQINQRLDNGKNVLERAEESLKGLERRLKILTDERDMARPRPLRPFESRRLATAILKVEETLSLQKDFLTRMQRIADAAQEEAKRFPQERYNELKLIVQRENNLTRVLKGKDSLNELRFTP